MKYKAPALKIIQLTTYYFIITHQKQPVTTSDFSVKYSEAHSKSDTRLKYESIFVRDWRESALMWQEFKLCEKGLKLGSNGHKKELF